jgi:hypothetical protein
VDWQTAIILLAAIVTILGEGSKLLSMYVRLSKRVGGQAVKCFVYAAVGLTMAVAVIVVAQRSDDSLAWYGHLLGGLAGLLAVAMTILGVLFARLKLETTS